MSVAQRGLNLRVTEELADHRQRCAAGNEHGREGVAQIVNTNRGQIGFRLHFFPEPIDVLKGLAFDIAGEYPLAVFGHSQPDRAKQRGGGGADRRAMQTALLRGVVAGLIQTAAFRSN